MSVRRPFTRGGRHLKLVPPPRPTLKARVARFLQMAVRTVWQWIDKTTRLP